MNIDGISIGYGEPCRFVAEVSNNHNGSKELAHALVVAAKAAGAEFVKFQAYTADELVALRGDGKAPAQWGAQGWSMRDLYEKARTPLEWLPDLFAHARNIGIVPFASVFGLRSLAMARDVDCPAYKIAALDNRHTWLIEAAHAMGRPVLVSTHEATPIMYTSYPVYTLYCPPGYPTPHADVRLPRAFRHVNGFYNRGDRLQHCEGFSSHCLDPDLPIAAVARGATLIEMHMQLAEVPSELEANISLTQHEFAAMIQRVRNTEAMLAD